MATSVCPLRHGRPKVSVTITASLLCVEPSSARLILTALASGSSGSRATYPLGTFDLSMPELAQTKPCLVSVMITPCPLLTTRLDSLSTSSTSLGSFPSAAATLFARDPGTTLESLTSRPSAFDTIFCFTTMTSPPASLMLFLASPTVISSERSSPEATSGKPFTGMTSSKLGVRHVEGPH